MKISTKNMYIIFYFFVQLINKNKNAKLIKYL